jgi:hypothetical protein
MIAHNENILVSKYAHFAVAFFRRESAAVMILIVGNLSVELKTGEVHRFQLSPLNQAQRRGIRTMSVQCRPGGFVVPVDGCMQAKGGALHGARSFDDVAIQVADQQGAGGDLRPEVPFRVYQEQVFLARQ